MQEVYRHGSRHYISWSRGFRRRKRLLGIVLLLLFLAAGFIARDLYFVNKAGAPVTSKTTIKSVSFDGNHFSTPYFQFAESGTWKLAEAESNPSKYVWKKYQGSSPVVQHQLIVYVNQTPPPPELAAAAALPVKIKDSSFEAGVPSPHCGGLFEPGEPRRVRPQTVGGTTILCDPDMGQRRVIFGSVGGDYNLRLKRSDGSSARYVIIYKDQRISSDDEILTQIADSFKAL